MQRQREDWNKDIGRIEKNGDRKSEDISGVKKAICTYIIHLYSVNYVCLPLKIDNKNAVDGLQGRHIF
jgi:hypothetical protein